MSETEYVELTVKVPKKILDLLNDLEKFYGMTATEYIEYNIMWGVRADLDATGDGPFFDPEKIVERYGLKEILEDP